MKIIAETKDGYLIHAKGTEIKEVLTAVTGQRPDEIKIGQKIPAIDYASTITKIKSLHDNYQVKQVLLSTQRLYDEIEELKTAVVNAKEIEI